MPKSQGNERYIIDTFHARSLQNNPLGSPINRDLNIYLPPNYFDSENTRYPVLYFLHGYGGDNQNWTFTSKNASEKALQLDRIPKKIIDKIDLDRLPNFEQIDFLIEKREIQPFIMVQPDASLHIPNIHNRKNLSGKIATKGSLYVNSPFSGNYEDYIVRDVLDYIDSSYRTIPDKNHRALLGGSMGGAGVLRYSLFYPEKFIAGAALSPGSLHREYLDWQVIFPLNVELFGEEFAKKMGKKARDDILDTCDLVFSNDKPLIPSIKRDENGKVVTLNQGSLNNWMRYNVNTLIKKHPEALKSINLLINCAQDDEMGAAIGTKEIHETLNELDIPHQFELYDDPAAVLSPHILGIAYHVLPAIRFCLQFIN